MCLTFVHLEYACIVQVRVKADRKYLKAARKMAERYNKQRNVQTFTVGSKISVRIPRIDRASSDLPRLPCVIVEVLGGVQHLYRLRYSEILYDVLCI